MAEQLAGLNKTELDVYSQSERQVGVWIDGKPVYEITIPFTKDPNNSRTFIDVSSLHIDKIISYDGAWTQRTDNAQNPITSADTNASYNCGVYFMNNQISLLYGNDIKSVLVSGYIIVRYIKVTS